MIWLLSLCLAQVPEPSAAPKGLLVDAAEAELERAMQLELPDADPPYYARVVLFEGRQRSVTASLGGVWGVEDEDFRSARVEVRVGSPELDNLGFSDLGENPGVDHVWLALGDDPVLLRQDLWLALDESYKGAVANLARREAHRLASEQERAPSFTASDAVQGSWRWPADRSVLQGTTQRARTLSAAFRDEPAVVSSRVYLRSWDGEGTYLDSEGTRALESGLSLSIRVVAEAADDRGRSVRHGVSFLEDGTEPPVAVEEQLVQVEAVADQLEAWTQIPWAEEGYTGPVLFETAAAAEMFRDLLVPLLEGTPSPEMDERSFGFARGKRPEPASVGDRLLPPGWTVADDPSVGPLAQALDDEGVLSRPVTMVEDGEVRELLEARTPSAAGARTNGHAEASRIGAPYATAVNVEITPARALATKKLHKEALKLTEAEGLDRILVVRRLVDPSLEQNSPMRIISMGMGRHEEIAPGLPAPLEAWFLRSDGEMVPVRGLKFRGVTSQALRDIVAAGPAHEETVWRAPYDDLGMAAGPDNADAVQVTAPAVLVRRLELVVDDVDQTEVRVPSPLAKP